jgi:hypothetical protein
LHFAIAAGQRLFSEHTQLTHRHVVEVRDRQPLITVVLIVQDDVRPGVWASELEEVLLRVGHRFGRVDLRRRMRDYVSGLLSAALRLRSDLPLPHASAVSGWSRLLIQSFPP